MSLHRKNLIDIQKIETNLSFVKSPKQYFEHQEGRVGAIYEVNYCQQQKRIGERSQLIHFSHIVIILNLPGKHMVKANNKNRNMRTMCLKLTIKAPE